MDLSYFNRVNKGIEKTYEVILRDCIAKSTPESSYCTSEVKMNFSHCKRVKKEKKSLNFLIEGFYHQKH